ncbi:MAG: transposase [Proteobacteria bacterium]|nr:transposase [Pseudomonadota bacterium]
MTVHVIQRGNNKGRIFETAKDSGQFLAWLTEVAETYGLSVHAYVLMTNHFHLLATLESKDSLARTMQSLGIRYTRYFNTVNERSGTLYEGRYRACVIDRDDYFLGCSRYIEMNPVRAGMAASPDVYRWSSYKANAAGREDALVTRHDIYLRLGHDDETRRASYRALFEVPSQAFDDTLRAATNRGIGLDDVANIRKPGRPKKAA